MVSEGDLLNGHSLYNPHISTEAIDGDTIAFCFSYDTPAKGALYTATFIPAPGTLTLAGAAGILAAMRRRR